MVSPYRLVRELARLDPLGSAHRVPRRQSPHAASRGHRLALIFAALAFALSATALPSKAQEAADQGTQASARLSELGYALGSDNPDYARQTLGPELAAESVRLLPLALAEQRARADETGPPEFDFLFYCHSVLRDLIVSSGPWTKELLEGDEFRNLRALFVAAGYADDGVLEDADLVNSLIQARRWEQASQVIEASIEVFSGTPSRLAYLTGLRAELYRLKGDFESALEHLAAADSLLDASEQESPEFMWFEARCQASGVRGQLQQFRGRLGPALKAFSNENSWARRYEQEAGEWKNRAVGVRLTAALRFAEYLMFSSHLSEVVQELAPFLDREDLLASERAQVRFITGTALAEQEILTPVEPSRARELLLEALAEPSLPHDSRVHANLMLVRLEHLVERPQESKTDRLRAAQKYLDAASALLFRSSRQSANDSPLSEIAFFRTMQATLAREASAGPEILRPILEEFDAVLDQLIPSWGSRRIPPGGVGILHDGRRRLILEEYIRLCFALDLPERALQRVIEVQTQGSLAQVLGATAVSTSEVQEQLINGGGILVYLPTLARTQLLLLDASGLTQQLLPVGGFDLQALAKKWDLLNTTGRDTSEVVAALGAGLLPPSVQERVRDWSYVYIVGSDLLDHPPFEVLPFGASTFGRSAAGAYLPSLPVGVLLAKRMREPTSPMPGALSLFAASLPSQAARERWPELSDIGLEAEHWARLSAAFEGQTSRSWQGEQATPEALFAQFPSGAAVPSGRRILHFFCHGVFDPSAGELPAGLALSGADGSDGLVWCPEITERVASPDLVILAACGAARGPTRRGEDGIAHLGGAFLQAGANTVILARSSLEVAAAFRAAEILQAELAAGTPPAEALRRARNQVASERDSPNIAAPLFAFGVAHLPLFVAAHDSPLSNGGQRSLALGLGLTILGGIALGARMRSKRRPSEH